MIMLEDVPLDGPETAVLSRTRRWRTQLLGLHTDPSDDHDRYVRLCQQYEALLQEDVSESAADKDEENVIEAEQQKQVEVGGNLDPLTAMVQAQEERTAKETELEKAYLVERARRNRGLDTGPRVIEEEPDDAAAYRQLIAKDLHRLSPTFGNTSERLQALTRVLMVFALEHASTMGYLQGMHEIASFVLYALELEEKAGELVAEIESECFALSEAILTQIAAAYDTDPKEPLALQSQRILHLTAEWPALFQRLKIAFCHIPSQLVFTKWMRLLFSREVQSHEAVMQIWDAVFAVEGTTLQTTLEALAAARLLQHGQVVLMDMNDDDALLHWFMNIPPEKTVDVWLRRMRVVLKLEAPFDSHPAIGAPVTAPKSTVPRPPFQQQLSPTAVGYVNGGAAAVAPSWDITSATQFASSFTEKLAAQTQSLTKLISQEWEGIQQHQQPFPHQHPVVQRESSASSKYNLDYYPRDLPRQPSATAAQPGEIRPTRTTTTSRLQNSILVLQQFAVDVEQRAGVRVPPHVWTALADLQTLQDSASFPG